MTHDRRLILDNIRSVHNVGSIFRTAETLGISHIYCIGTTPTPVDRFKRLRKDFVKVSLGSEGMVKWQHCEDGASVIEDLKNEGFQIISLEQADNTVDYKKINVVPKCAVILGNEVEGVSKDLLNLSDVIAEIPVMGKKESLNVSVAGAVFLYRIFDNNF